MTAKELEDKIHSLENQSGQVYVKVGKMMYPITVVLGRTINNVQHFIILDTGIVEVYDIF